ncbi:aminotransferase class I/II-fold pyridoxal phosphate-dependent enzyme [Owenweeksia hongkongensis]|uniref:aminotransferase class I/II-fold pyridoxal phosphate-dependent enzyme n=1 Tax=Owenweeksia hongkongensis TaxID=253245 RepID=UPI003A95C73C
MKDILKYIAQTHELKQKSNAYRSLKNWPEGIDFFSNDYLGFAKDEALKISQEAKAHGAGGSRLISGNHSAYTEVESFIANQHSVESALIFPTGFMANLGVLSSLPQRSDVILFDELCHASIRDGIRLSNASAYKFRHNDLDDLAQKLEQFSSKHKHVFVVTESVFSMDGDIAPLQEIAKLCDHENIGLIVDEAHALGVFDLGLVHQLGLQQKILATIVTFSKAMGLHGGAVLGPKHLINFLVNHARSLIYTTGLPPESVLKIKQAYLLLQKEGEHRRIALNKHIASFKAQLSAKAQSKLLPSSTPIQSIVFGNNNSTKQAEQQLLEKGFLVKAILQPTVPLGTERIRIILHAFNTEADVRSLANTLNQVLES